MSKTAILVQGEPVAQVQDLDKDDYWNIPSLEEKLRDEKKRLEVLHEGDNEGGFKGEVNIQADKEVPFKVIKRVMSRGPGGLLQPQFRHVDLGGLRNPDDTRQSKVGDTRMGGLEGVVTALSRLKVFPLPTVVCSRARSCHWVF